MEPSETYLERIAMAEMHGNVQERIKKAYDSENYIECCWLCYACFESRVDRTMNKICCGCSKAQRADARHIGISTKLSCLNRLRRSDYSLFKGADLTEITNIISWCEDRNKLIHELVSLDRYDKSDYQFKNLAKRGMGLVSRLYTSVSIFRDNYYEASEVPEFDENVVSKCSLKTKCVKEEE